MRIFKACVLCGLFLLMAGTLHAQNQRTLTTAVWSPSEAYIAIVLRDSGTGESLVNIYDTQSQSIINTFYNTTGLIQSLAWSPDESRIITSDREDNSIIRDPFTDEILDTFGSGSGGMAPIIYNLSWNYDGSLLANDYNFGVRLDLRDGLTAELVQVPDTFPRGSDFIWHPSEPLLAVIDREILRVMDTEIFELQTEVALDDNVILLGWYGNRLITLTQPELNTGETHHIYIFQIWDSTTGNLLTEYELGQYGALGRIQLFDSASQMARIRSDNTVQILNPEDGSVLQFQQFPSDQRIFFSPNSERFALVSHNGEVELSVLPLNGERLEITPTNNLLYFDIPTLPTFSVILGYADEAPIDREEDYFGVFSFNAEGKQYDDLPYYEFAPDFDWLTYHRQNEAGGFDLHEDVFNYSRDSVPVVTGGWNVYPSYSTALWKEDTEIAFWHSEDNITFELAILNQDRDLVQSIALPRQPHIEPVTWSADSSQRDIIFSMTSENADFDLYQINLETETITAIHENPANDYHPQWSPDGNELLFVSDRNGIEQIFVLDRTSGEIRLVSDGHHPQWSLTGSRIAFMRDDAIYIVNADGTDEILFVENAVLPRWLR